MNNPFIDTADILRAKEQINQFAQSNVDGNSLQDASVTYGYTLGRKLVQEQPNAANEIDFDNLSNEQVFEGVLAELRPNMADSLPSVIFASDKKITNNGVPNRLHRLARAAEYPFDSSKDERAATGQLSDRQFELQADGSFRQRRAYSAPLSANYGMAYAKGVYHRGEVYSQDKPAEPLEN